jgi:hypothetical protein
MLLLGFKKENRLILDFYILETTLKFAYNKITNILL